MVAAAPAWFSENLLLIAGGTLLVVTALVVRMVQKAALRLALLVLVGAVALFTYANRVELERCATTCECQLVDRQVTVPGCRFSF